MARFAILKKTQNLTILFIVARASRLCLRSSWHPKAAQTALKPALALNPNLPEIRVLNGLAALMQGNLIQAWQDLQYLKQLKI